MPLRRPFGQSTLGFGGLVARVLGSQCGNLVTGAHFLQQQLGCGLFLHQQVPHAVFLRSEQANLPLVLGL